MMQDIAIKNIIIIDPSSVPSSSHLLVRPVIFCRALQRHRCTACRFLTDHSHHSSHCMLHRRIGYFWHDRDWWSVMLSVWRYL